MNRGRITAAVFALCLAIAATTAGVTAQDIERRPVEDPLFGVSSVVPAEWQSLGNGVHARGTPPDDLALVAIQSAPATIEELWPSLLPQFALSEVPPISEERTIADRQWAMYRFDVTQGAITVAVELALSESDGTTALLLLQAAPDELAVLREQVLEPALEAFAPLAPEPTPHPSTFDYRIEEVTFEGGADDVQLAGTLTLPDGPGPHPVVVTMTGSGAQDRDESLRPITTLKPFAILADALTSAGVGVLRYDDRGVGGSSGDYEAATIEELAEDARAAIDYLESRPDVDPRRIGLLGHSEGGLYAALLGASDPRVAYIALMAPAVVDGITLIVEQSVAMARAAGSTDEQLEVIRGYTAEAMPLAVAGDIEALEAVGREAYGRLWDLLSDEERIVAGERETYIQRQLDAALPAYRSDWFRSFLAYDPGVDWGEVRVPVLGVFGAKDVQVLATSNEAALRERLAEAGNEDVETLVLPDANHLFQAAETGAVGEYSTLEPAFTEGFVDAIVDWVAARAGVGEAE